MKFGMKLASHCVRDVMTEPVVFVNAQHTLDEAWQILHAHGISGAPVLGASGKLAGMITRSDLADRRRRSSASSVVKDIATRVVYAVRAGDPVMTAVRLMLGESIHRALVVNDDGTIAGIVAPTDILKALVRGEDLGDDGAVEYFDLRK
jgi:CBS-domain-containing membrane protein